MGKKLLYNCNKLSLDYFDKLLKENVWKAFTTIHAGIHHQMRIILRYRFNKNENGESGRCHLEKWMLIYKKGFAVIVSDLFITGIITLDFKEKILKFNNHRNMKLGHIDIYEKTELSDKEIKDICLEGIEIVKELDKIIKIIFFSKASSSNILSNKN